MWWELDAVANAWLCPFPYNTVSCCELLVLSMLSSEVRIHSSKQHHWRTVVENLIPVLQTIYLHYIMIFQKF